MISGIWQALLTITRFLLHYIHIQNVITIILSLIIFYVLFFLFKSLKIFGSIVYVCSIILYIISLFMKNIFLEFLSFTFLSIFLFLSIYYLIIFLYYKNKTISLINLNYAAVYPFEKYYALIEAARLPIPFTGIYFVLRFDILENNNIIDKYETHINYEGKNFIKLLLLFRRHGKFILNNFYFLFKDIFGLTEYKIKCDFQKNVVVFPYFVESIRIPFLLDKGGEEILQSKIKINSTDFFENRKYYPGDDTRRINWKIFAHSGELHIREVEKIPPRIGQISILYAPYSEYVYEYEYISSLFLATINYLIKLNYEIRVAVPYTENIYILDSSSEKEFNDIINYSYMPFTHEKSKTLKNPIIFASFDEFNNLLKKGRLHKKFCAVTYYDPFENIENIYKYLFYIHRHDNLFREYLSIGRGFFIYKKREKLLMECKKKSESMNIKLNLYRIGSNFNEIVKKNY